MFLEVTIFTIYERVANVWFHVRERARIYVTDLIWVRSSGLLLIGRTVLSIQIKEVWWFQGGEQPKNYIILAGYRGHTQFFYRDSLASFSSSIFLHSFSILPYQWLPCIALLKHSRGQRHRSFNMSCVVHWRKTSNLVPKLECSCSRVSTFLPTLSLLQWVLRYSSPFAIEGHHFRGFSGSKCHSRTKLGCTEDYQRRCDCRERHRVEG